MRRLMLSACLAGFASAQLPAAPAHLGPPLELVHAFYGQMPVGFAYNSKGRLFVTYPRWEDPVKFTLGEIVNGRELAYPNAELNRFGPGKGIDFAKHMVSTQGIVIDARDRLWLLDSGTINLGKVLGPGAAKLIGIDTNTNKVVKTITFPGSVVTPDTYMNDLRVALRRGQDGVAYITDSGEKSGNAIIVVDLASGRSWRKLSGDVSVRATPKFVGVVEGTSYLNRPKGKPASHNQTGADGLAISPDGKTLYYAPNASRRYYSIPTDALADENLPPEQVSAQVKDLGEKGVTDGMGEDALGRIYTTDYEQNAIQQRLPSGELRTFVRDPRLIWPDTIVLRGAYLYVSANQLNRQAKNHFGRDLRQKPFSIFRVKVDAGPVLLK